MQLHPVLRFAFKAATNWSLAALCLLLIVLRSPVPASPATANDPPGSFAHLVKKTGPAVVNIIVTKRTNPSARGGTPYDLEEPFQEFFERFFRDRLPREYRQAALGSGFVIDASGLILTNNHVVENALELIVRLSDNHEFKGTIVGRDTKTDLALIRIRPDSPLAVLAFGDSDALQVGDWVVAIGNPFGLGNTVTSGIVSAKYRQIGTGAYNNFIQTDAAVNPGNSGGPLLNMEGQVVGINSAIFSQTGANVGIGFAIPSSVAKELLPQLRLGKVRRSYLGVIVQDITAELRQSLRLPTEKGALVSDMIPGSPATKVGIKRGDVILSFDGKEIRNSHDLSYIVAAVPIGKKTSLEAIRNGQTIKLVITTEEMKEEDADESPGLGSQAGLSLQALTPEIAKSFDLSRTKGVLVTQVDEDSAGMEAGLVPGDIIIEAERKQVADAASLNRIMEKSPRNKPILLLVDRDGRTFFITITP